MSLNSDHHLGMFTDRRADEDGALPGPAHHSRPQAGRAAMDNLFKRGAYSCPELGRTCLRPGAYDAFELPSLFDGQRKPYRFSDPVVS